MTSSRWHAGGVNQHVSMLCSPMSNTPNSTGGGSLLPVILSPKPGANPVPALPRTAIRDLSSANRSLRSAVTTSITLAPFRVVDVQIIGGNP